MQELREALAARPTTVPSLTLPLPAPATGGDVSPRPLTAPSASNDSLPHPDTPDSTSLSVFDTLPSPAWSRRGSEAVHDSDRRAKPAELRALLLRVAEVEHINGTFCTSAFRFGTFSHRCLEI